ncbi:hypothetical protein DXC92_01270 [Clostridiales bacterium TF09-2AC]|uniref:hypothetical protein n=1 Tax=Enterocloster hominis (ex Hitch et al. 2024) TaxID=1917870 RepID=UPI000E76D815|nr:hypothetical protein [Lachnoclostridium pacaense]MCC2817599.1 hypothetical protein [Lachnoclostridium pacaense]RJW53928.1 hypothetical protein DXC92_01270 [Clostridiales bacterium TF09-2AC]
MKKGYRRFGVVWITVFFLICMSGCGQKTAAAGNPGNGAGMDSGAASAGESAAGSDRMGGSGGTSAGPDRMGGGDGTSAEDDSDGLKPGQAPADTEGLSGDTRTERFEILDVDDKSMLVCGAGDNDMSGLFRVGHGPVLENADGKPARISELKSGMIVELSWEGYVLESYPGQFGYQKLRITEDMGSRELEFYKQLIKNLAEVDPGLNDGITQSYFDLTMVGSLSDAEKEGLAYMGGTSFGAWGELATEKDLVESGALDPQKGLEHGILVTIEETSNSGSQLTCSARKYRSGTGAYYFSDVTATYKDGAWTYKIGAEMIS